MAKPFTKMQGGGYPGLAASPGTRDGTKFLRDDGTWQNPGSGSVPALLARFWVSIANAALPNARDMGALGAGLLQQTVAAGISTPQALALAAEQILFGGPASLVAQNGLFVFRPATRRLGIGTATPLASVHVYDPRPDPRAAFMVANDDTGRFVVCGFYAQQNPALVDDKVISVYKTGTGYDDGSGIIMPNDGVVEVAEATGAANLVASVFGSGDFIWVVTTTTPPDPASRALRMRLNHAGSLFLPASLGVGGYVIADPTSGELKIGAAPGGGTVTDVTGTAPITSSGGATPDIAIADFVASGASHARGAVPDPGASPGDAKFLRETGGWEIPAAMLGSWSFILKPAINSVAGLVADPRWLAPSQSDGEDETDAWDERGWPFAGTLPASKYSFYVKVIDGDSRQVDSGVWKWDFQLYKNGGLVDTVTITSGTGPDTANADDLEAFTPGDHVGVRVVGSQVSGTSTVGWIFAFVTVVLNR